jgi:predicted ABC-type ATPase
MLNQIARKVEQGESFAFETTLSGMNYARQIPLWRKAGYRVKLIFLSLPSAELAIARVRNRVAQGGHSIDEEVVRRRFDAGLKNFHNIYRRLVDSWAMYDNVEKTPKLIDSGDNPWGLAIFAGRKYLKNRPFFKNRDSGARPRVALYSRTSGIVGQRVRQMAKVHNP